MASGSNYLTTYYAKRIIGDTAAEAATKALLQTGTGIENDIWILHRTNRADLYGIKYMYDDTTNGTADRIELYGGQQEDNTDVPSAWIQLDTGDLYILGNVGIGHNPDTYKLYVNGGQTFLDNTTAASANNLSSQLIVANTDGTGVAIELWRNEYASWQIINNAGTLYIRNNWTTEKQSTYSQNGLIMDYNTGATSLPYLALGQTARNTSYKLYVNGTSYFNGNTTHNGIDYFANGTTYYINNSANSYLRDVKVRSLGIAQTDGTTGYGISLYNGPQTSAPTYGIMFAKTETYGTHGAVTSDWATYLTTSNTTNRGWIFRRGSTNVASIDGTGKIYLGYATNADNPGIYWNPYVESASDASDVSRIIQVKSGVAGGTELQIYQANDATDVINLVTPAYIYMNSKRAFTVSDSWLRINENLGFSSGIYTGSSLLRSDNQLQVGSDGAKFYANSSGNGYFSAHLGVAGTNTDYTFYVAGTAKHTNRLYQTNWIEFTDNTGLYLPSSGSGTHFYPANNCTYGSFSMQGAKGGYTGLNIGSDNNRITIMSNGTDEGIYNASKGRWVLYYNKSNDRIGIFTAGTNSGYNVQVNGSLYVTSTTQIAGTTYLASTVYINWPNSINVRHVNGCNWNASNKDLYLQYQQDAPIYLGNSAAYYISADGSYYSGNTPTNMNGTNRTLQIRYGSQNVAYGTTTTINFSPAFSNACIAVIPCCGQLGFGAYDCISVNMVSKSSFKVYNYNSSNVTMTVNYIAIGY